MSIMFQFFQWSSFYRQQKHFLFIQEDYQGILAERFIYVLKYFVIFNR